MATIRPSTTSTRDGGSSRPSVRTRPHRLSTSGRCSEQTDCDWPQSKRLAYIPRQCNRPILPTCPPPSRAAASCGRWAPSQLARRCWRRAPRPRSPRQRSPPPSPPRQPQPPRLPPPPPTTRRSGPGHPAGLGNKQVSIEWWRRNYTPGQPERRDDHLRRRGQVVPRALPEHHHHHSGRPVRPRDRPEVRHRHPAAEGRPGRFPHHRRRCPQVRRGRPAVAAAADRRRQEGLQSERGHRPPPTRASRLPTRCGSCRGTSTSTSSCSRRLASSRRATAPGRTRSSWTRRRS